MEGGKGWPRRWLREERHNASDKALDSAEARGGGARHWSSTCAFADPELGRRERGMGGNEEE